MLNDLLLLSILITLVIHVILSHFTTSETPYIVDKPTDKEDLNIPTPSFSDNLLKRKPIYKDDAYWYEEEQKK